MPRRVIKIDENTQVPLSLAWVSAGALVTIAMSFAGLLANQETAKADISELKAGMNGINEDRARHRDQILSAITDLKVEIGKIEQRLNIPPSKGE